MKKRRFHLWKLILYVSERRYNSDEFEGSDDGNEIVKKINKKVRKRKAFTSFW